MSNEELVAVIQSGAAERMAELWEQVKGLVKWKASRIMTALELRGNPCGVEFEDLYQSGYIAMVEAVHYYNPESSVAFSTCLINRLKTIFAEATGYRTKAGQNEPLNNSISLDTPLNDDSDSDMMEVVADPDGQKPTQGVEESIFHRQLHEAMEAALGAIPEQNAEILRLRYYQGMTLSDVGESRGVSMERIRHMENKALLQLRKPGIACHLWPFVNFDFYCGTGLGAFQNSGMSVQERYLMVQEERRERADRRFQEQMARRHETEFEETQKRLRQEAEDRVSRMTPEEKRALLEKYGYA